MKSSLNTDHWIQQEVTTLCNSNCGFCPRHTVGSRRTLGHITPEMVEILLERYAEAAPFSLNISGLGEPLMWPGIYDFIDRVKELDITLSMNTNALLLTEESSRLIDVLDSLQVNISLPTSSLYRAYKGHDGFDVEMENLRSWYLRKGCRKPVTDMRLLRFDQTAPHLKAFIMKYSAILHHGDAIKISDFGNWGGLINESFFGVERPETPGNIKLICGNLTNHLTITKEGNAFACCYSIAFPEDHPFKLGNVKDRSLHQLLHGRKHEELLQLQKDGVYVNECNQCSNTKLKPKPYSGDETPLHNGLTSAGARLIFE